MTDPKRDPKSIPVADITGVAVEHVCVFCKGRGNFDHILEDGSVLKCPIGPCESCKGTGRAIAFSTLERFIELVEQELEKRRTEREYERKL
jgi:hypothetical protein